MNKRFGVLIKTTASGRKTIAFFWWHLRVSFHLPPPREEVRKGPSSTPPMPEGPVSLASSPGSQPRSSNSLKRTLVFGVHLALSSFKSFTENISVKPNIVGYPCINPVMETLQIMYKKQIINLSKSSALSLVVDVFPFIFSGISLYTHLLKRVSVSCILKGLVKSYQKSRSHKTF